MIKISPSVLGADPLRLGEEIELVESLGIEWLHLDNMDGHFVPNISFGPDFVAAIRKKTNLFLDVHLMLDYPRKFIKKYVKAGADLITVHAEMMDDPATVLREIKAQGVKTGISIKPGTPPYILRNLLELCDLILVMTVEPGYGGQAIREDCIAKLPMIREMIRESGREIYLQVDGGVKTGNVRRLIDAGADVLVTGTGLFQAERPMDFVDAVRQAQEDRACGR